MKAKRFDHDDILAVMHFVILLQDRVDRLERERVDRLEHDAPIQTDRYDEGWRAAVACLSGVLDREYLLASGRDARTVAARMELLASIAEAMHVAAVCGHPVDAVLRDQGCRQATGEDDDDDEQGSGKR